MAPPALAVHRGCTASRRSISWLAEVARPSVCCPGRVRPGRPTDEPPDCLANLVGVLVGRSRQIRAVLTYCYPSLSPLIETHATGSARFHYGLEVA
jgi:hypothetical protein